MKTLNGFSAFQVSTLAMKISMVPPKALITFVRHQTSFSCFLTQECQIFRLNVAIDPLGYDFTLEIAAPNAITD